MMVRLIGAVMIISASASGGIIAAGMWRKRVLQLEAFHGFVVHITRQIDGFLTPLEKIYAEYDSEVLLKCGFMEALRTWGGVMALDKCRRGLYISESDTAQLKAFFSGLGRHTPQEENRHCTYFEKQIGDTVKKAKDELSSKTRLCRGFGILFGIMLAVILI